MDKQGFSYHILNSISQSPLLHDEGLHNSVAFQVVATIMIFVVAFGLGEINRRLIFRPIIHLIYQRDKDLPKKLAELKLLRFISFFTNITIVYLLVGNIPSLLDTIQNFIAKLSLVMLLFLGTRLVTLFLELADYKYAQKAMQKQSSFSGYIGVLSFFMYLVAFIFSLSIIINESPFALLTTLAGFTALFLLAFRDTIMSIYASVVITHGQLVEVGDWIEMPSDGVDGEVDEVSLNVVKVRNWDKTIMTFPTYKLVGGTFKNWQGMRRLGIRRIKRIILLDMNSIRFLSELEVNQIKSQIPLLSDMKIKDDLHSFNAVPQDPITKYVSNVTLFRNYMVQYLHAHPKISNRGMLLVREKEPSQNGLPIEIYCFSDRSDWVYYENLQSSIFDHILSVVALFKLRVYQRDQSWQNGLQGTSSEIFWEMPNKPHGYSDIDTFKKR
ncbi:mechanosensitive ion channel family protein [Persicobacter psychrovividus]|uniref:Mechanosensitive ion channel MscS domain-containing protein n=1 Tax=Persicobacter psychrovividus TaxID=387638 RepID=A0ABN6LJU1_9BACT|nr:hypothetical protein PEPS_40170 [Persicobacter psychrovividus]